ncbi:MAG: hypothetical protein FWF59_12450 [Turicibacter sp.]|nr:hypothetical protein [Turicibacter sp.]
MDNKSFFNIPQLFGLAANAGLANRPVGDLLLDWQHGLSLDFCQFP